MAGFGEVLGVGGCSPHVLPHSALRAELALCYELAFTACLAAGQGYARDHPGMRVGKQVFLEERAHACGVWGK